MAVCFAESVTTWVFPLLGRCSIFHRNEENRAQNHMIYHQSPHSLATKYREADSDTYVNLRLGAVEAVETEGPLENWQVCKWIKLEEPPFAFFFQTWQRCFLPVHSSTLATLWPCFKFWNLVKRGNSENFLPLVDQWSEALQADRVTFTWEPETLWMVGWLHLTHEASRQRSFAVLRQCWGTFLRLGSWVSGCIPARLAVNHILNTTGVYPIFIYRIYMNLYGFVRKSATPNSHGS